MTAVGDQGDPRGIWNRRVRGRRQTHGQILARSQGLQWNGNKFLGCYFALREGVNSDSVSGITGPCARWIGQRTNRSIQMLSVGAEGQTNEIALVSVLGKPCIGKVGDLIGSEIEDRDRLVPQSFLRSMSIIEERGVTSVGTEHHCHWKTVGAANVSRRWDRELFAAGQIHNGIVGLRESQCAWQDQENTNPKKRANHDASAT